MTRGNAQLLLYLAVSLTSMALQFIPCMIMNITGQGLLVFNVFGNAHIATVQQASC